MRRLLQALGSSDPGLLGMVAGLLVIAACCRFVMREASPIPTDKTVVTVCKGGPKRDRVEMKELRAAFAEARPDIYINVIQSNLQRKSDTMIAAGVPPDLVYVLCDKVDYYAASGALLDLVPLIAEDPELRRAFGRSLFDDPTLPAGDFFQQTITPFVRETNGRKRLYVLPVNYTPFVVYYSKDLFDKYHVPYPDENWTWEGLRQRALALTRDANGRRPDQPGFDPSDVVSYGFHYAKWQHGVENFIRQNGGRLVNDEGTRVVADDPRTVAALQFLYDLKYRDRVCPPGQRPSAQDVSLSKGTLGMYLWGVFAIPTLREQAPNLDWDIAPLPRGPDGQRASIVFANGWGITKKSQNPAAAFAFLKFLVSPQGLAITGKHQVFLPARRSMVRQTIAADPTRKPRSTWVLTHDMDHGYAHPPFSTVAFYDDVYESINYHFDQLLARQNPAVTPAEACAAMTEEGNTILRRDRPARRSTAFGILALAGALIPMLLLARRVANRRSGLSIAARRETRWGYALISPWLIGFLFFAAGPILISATLSFAQWQSLSDFTRCEFIGLENYRVALSGDDPKFWTALWVTFRYALLAVPAGLVAGLALALLMNQRVRGINVFRTLYYVPAILPSVAAAVLWWHLFDVNHGWVNRLLAVVNFGGWITRCAGLLGESFPIAWLESPIFTPYVFVVMSLWAVGGGMIIYLAGLQNIPTQFYEAAQIDGAGRWAQLRHVTLPLLSPVIFFNLVMGIIGSFQVFNTAFVLFDGQTGPGDSALFYGLHLFREAFFKYRLGYASALAWILFVVILGFTGLVFRSSPMWVHYEAARGRRV
ncbi:MAG: extracellular solute-binding protein [Planctomycetes bacterium]|nr:extracellular solute-binding protein [Planctomycetota bacterium]